MIEQVILLKNTSTPHSTGGDIAAERSAPPGLYIGNLPVAGGRGKRGVVFWGAAAFWPVPAGTRLGFNRREAFAPPVRAAPPGGAGDNICKP